MRCRLVGGFDLGLCAALPRGQGLFIFFVFFHVVAAIPFSAGPVSVILRAR